MKHKLFFRPLAVAALATLFFSCANEEQAPADASNALLEMRNADGHLFKGPVVEMGNGKARSWVILNADGTPSELGIEMTLSAVDGLSADDHETFVLPLHRKAKDATPFDHIGLNWNPHGHQPQNIFTVPHFDVHFYMMSLADRLAIPEWTEENDAQFSNYPAEGYMPAGYFTPPGIGTSEAQMGKHWIPVNLGDYLPFSKIMIFGSYDGMFNFIEPMITLDYLMSGEDFSATYPQPMYADSPDNYPSRYNIYHDSQNGNIYISLSDFSQIEAE